MYLKNPPTEAWGLIRKLNEKPRALTRFLRKEDPRLTYIRDLDQYKERGLIQHIAFLLFDDHLEIAKKAGHLIEDRLKGITLEELIELDQSMRGRGEYDYSSLSAKKPNDLKKLRRFENPISFLGICSFFPNGYVREHALRNLCNFKTGKELRFFLLRLNDWVPQVRIIAKTEVVSRINPQHIGSFVDNFDLIERLYSWGRDKHDEVLHAIEETVALPGSREHLLRGIKHENRRIRKLCVRIAAQTDSLPLMTLYQMVSKDLDPIVRLQIIVNAKDGADPNHLLELTDAFTRDSFVGIRREALLLSVEYKLNNMKRLLNNALSDSHCSMRELARFYLKKDGASTQDFLAYYQNLLKSEPPKIGVVLGLGEVGEEGVALAILPLLSHTRAEMRRAAWKAIANIKPEYLRTIALEKIKQDTPSVVKEIRNFILKHFVYYTISDLWEIFESTDRPIVKICIISFTEKISKWQSIWYLLKAGQETSPKIHAIIEQRLNSWLFSFNRSFTQPTKEEILQIRQQISKSPLNKDLLGQLTQIIATYQ